MPALRRESLALRRAPMLKSRALPTPTPTTRPRTPVLRAKLIVIVTKVVRAEVRAEGRQGRYKGRKAQAIQEEDKIRGKATDKKRSY